MLIFLQVDAGRIQNMLEVVKLSCIREDSVLFSELSFTVSAGEMIQIEGPNGVGKTSLLRLLAGLSSPADGHILWQQTDTLDDRESYHQDLLYLGHLPGVKAELTAFENLFFYHAMHKAVAKEKVWDALAQVGLAGYEDQLACHLSAGQQRRIALARLWLSDKKLWILDEPFTAIDKNGVKVLERLFLAHADNGGSVILTTHQDLQFSAGRLRKITLTRQHLTEY